MEFIIDNFEIIVAVVGGLSVGGYMLTRKSGSRENDLTPLYVKYKRHSDGISKSTKSIF